MTHPEGQRIDEDHDHHGPGQLPWLQGALASSRVLADATAGVGDADMELAILRVAGPRLQAAMSGAILLAAWVDFLSLADAVLRHCPSYSAERLLVDMNRVQRLIGPPMVALASQDPAQVEAATIALPGLMAQLTDEFASIRESARVAAERSGQIMMAAQLVEMVTLMSALKMSLPRLMPPPPAAPVTLGATLVVGSNGVMAGSQVVVSAEWVEMVRRLVQAGVISLPAVSAAVRIHAAQVMMAQAKGDVPQGIREALGDGPEVRGMHETGKAGAGMAEAPRHHVLPQEHRAWFEQRGFKGGASQCRDRGRTNADAKRDPEHRREAHEGLQDPNDLRFGERAMSNAWEGNWKARLYERVRALGFTSLTAFAEARPTASLVALAEELGKDDIAGVQVLSGLLAEAEQRRQVKRFERDVFVRMFTQNLPNGWPAVLDDANIARQ